MSEETVPTLMIATPMYGGMCTGHYVAGLVSTLTVLRNTGVNTFVANIMNESLITRARNDLVNLFLEKGFDYLMFIDADISFKDDAVPQLLAANKDVVCGLYPKKEIDWKKVQIAAQAGKENLADFGGAFVLNMDAESSETDEHGCVEIKHGGTGFMLIKRRVFEILKEHVPTYRTSSYKNPDTGEYVKPLVHEFFTTSIDAHGTLLSEDYHFCELWRKHGGKVYANPFIHLEHVGTYIFGGDIMRAGGNIK